MSSFNDYVACSNNSINDNVLNAKKARSTAHQLKQLLRPIVALLKNKSSNSKKRCTYKKSICFEDGIEDCTEMEQNLANELLEERIFAEVDRCGSGAAVPVYRNGAMDVVPVMRGQRYVPVHFAKTEAGTFFWTSVSRVEDCDFAHFGDRNAFTQHQKPSLQVPCDRWAQA